MVAKFQMSPSFVMLCQMQHMHVRPSELRKNIENYKLKTRYDYHDLAYGAKISGLVKIGSDQQMKQVTAAIKIFHEKNLTNSKMRRVCPS